MSQTEVQLVKGLNLDPAAPADATKVDSSGRFLVGTSSYSGNATVVLENNSSNTSFGHLRINRNTSSPADGNTLGLITFSDNTTSYSADIFAARDGGTWSASSKPTRLVFSTAANGASSPTERMRISNSGQVQINLPSNTTSRHIGIVNTSGTIGWTFGNGITSATRQFVVYDNEAGAARTVIDSSGNFKFNSGYGSAATAYGVRAWVNFNGTGTVAIRSSGNVSSITDNTTGNFTVNFTNSLPDDDYCYFGGIGDGTSSYAIRNLTSRRSADSFSQNFHQFACVTDGNTAFDPNVASIAFIR